MGGRWRWLLGLLLVGIVVAVAVGRAGHQRPGTDFWTFWSAGSDFAHGRPLYGPGVDNRPFVYPPFAAQVFQILALFPVKIAAGLFYLVSVALWGLTAWLTRDIVRTLRPGVPDRTSALVLALILSAQFVVNNLNLLQMNLVTFGLCLAGVRGLAQGRPRAVGWFVVAAGLKIVPVFFVFWGAVRGGKRALLTALAAGAACLILPIIQRGPTQGAADLTAYYDTWLSQFASGKVVTSYTNQNVAALVYRAVTAPDTADQYRYNYLPSLEALAPVLYRGLAGLVLAGFVARLAWLARSRAPLTPLEIAGVFLTSHLLSGITWKAHLVTLLFVFYAVFSLDTRGLGPIRRGALWVGWFGIAIAGLVGRDLFGDKIHHYMGGYSVFVWVMLWLWALTAILDDHAPVPVAVPGPRGG
jgi:alpha-1,2-mannosyltransferase